MRLEQEYLQFLLGGGNPKYLPKFPILMNRDTKLIIIKKNEEKNPKNNLWVERGKGVGRETREREGLKNRKIKIVFQKRVGRGFKDVL